MKKQVKVIESNAIIVFNHDIRASELNAKIPKSFQGDIVIHGHLVEDEELQDTCYALNIVDA